VSILHSKGINIQLQEIIEFLDGSTAVSLTICYLDKAAKSWSILALNNIS
jgi:hypothetical protein